MTKEYSSPACNFRLYRQKSAEPGQVVVAIQNQSNGKYFDSSITTMAEKIKGDSQKWILIRVDEHDDAIPREFYIKNLDNGKYMTRHAKKLSESAGKDEVYIIDLLENRDKHAF